MRRHVPDEAAKGQKHPDTQQQRASMTLYRNEVSASLPPPSAHQYHKKHRPLPQIQTSPVASAFQQFPVVASAFASHPGTVLPPKERPHWHPGPDRTTNDDRGTSVAREAESTLRPRILSRKHPAAGSSNSAQLALAVRAVFLHGHTVIVVSECFI